MKGYDSFESGGVTRIEGMDVGVITISGMGGWSLDSGDDMLILGWEWIGLSGGCEVGGSISCGEVCRFLVKIRKAGRDFAFVMILRMVDILWYRILLE